MKLWYIPLCLIQTGSTDIYPTCACAAIILNYPSFVVVGTKIARSQDLGICHSERLMKPLKSSKNFLQYFELFGKAHEHPKQCLMNYTPCAFCSCAQSTIISYQVKIINKRHTCMYFRQMHCRMQNAGYMYVLSRVPQY